MHLRKAAIWLIGLTAMSYALAYLRDVGIAALWGASPQTDAFFAGTFPAMTFYAVALAGSIAPALVPFLTEKAGTAESFESRQRQAATLSAIGSRLLLVLLCAVAAGEIFAFPIMYTLTPGLGAEAHAHATLYLRLSLPMLLFLGPSSLAGALLNARREFRVPALGSLLYSGTVLASVALAAAGAELGAVALGMVAGAALQMMILLHSLRGFAAEAGINRRVPPRAQRGVTPAKVMALAFPMLLFVGLTQLLPLIERWIGSGLQAGALSHLAYAYKFYSLPAIVVATSLATVLLPGLSTYAGAQRPDLFAATVRKGFSSVVLLNAPLAAWFCSSSPLLVSVFLTRGNFTQADAAATAQLLSIYSLGLLPLSASLVLVRAFHARRQGGAPVLAGGAGVVVYFVVAIMTVSAWGAAGLAAAMASANVACALVLVRLLAKELPEVPLGALFRENFGAVAAAIGAGGLIWISRIGATPASNTPWAGQIISLGASAIGILVLYLSACLLLGVLTFGRGGVSPGIRVTGRIASGEASNGS